MKGFKDKNKKFHPINNKKGVRKSRDQNAKTQGVRLKRSDGSRIKKIKIWKFDDAPKELQEKILEKNRDINVGFGDDFWADYDGIIYDRKTNIGDYDVFENYGNKYYDLDRGQYIQFPDLQIKDEKKLAKMLGIPESLQLKVDFNFVSEGERTTELEFTEESTLEVVREDDTYEDYLKYVDKEDKSLTKADWEKLQKAISKWSDLMHQAWVSLRDNYEYQFTDEAVKETLIANDYDFDEDGDMA